MINKKLKIYFCIAFLSLSLYGCNNEKNEIPNNETIKQEANDSNLTKNKNIVLNDYWVADIREGDELFCQIYKIRDNEILGYTNYEYTTEDIFRYPINELTSDGNTMKLKALFKDDNGSRDVTYNVNILSDNEIKVSDDMTLTEYTFKKKTLEEVINLAYSKYYIDFGVNNFQAFLGKSEDELYNIANLVIEGETTREEEVYIQSIISKKDASDKVLNSNANKGANIVHEHDIYYTKFGNKKGYLMTLREYGEFVDHAIVRIFLDVHTGNIYEYDLNLATIDLDIILDTIDINSSANERSKADDLYSIEDARNKVIDILTEKDYVDFSNKSVDISYDRDIVNNKGKSCYAFTIFDGDAQWDLWILIEKDTLDAICMFSNGDFLSIDDF